MVGVTFTIISEREYVYTKTQHNHNQCFGIDTILPTQSMVNAFELAQPYVQEPLNTSQF